MPGSACTARTTSSAGPPGSTWPRSGSRRPPASSWSCDELGIGAADVLAIGDGRNDLEMLRWAGRGVAMGQAVQEVHDAADASTASVLDDGAAVEIDRWFGVDAAAGVSRLPAEWSPSGSGSPLWTREETADIVAGRHRPHWHPDYPRRGRPRRGDPVATRATPGGRGTWCAAATGSARSASSGRPAPPRRGRPAEAEVGYGLVAEARGWGFATEALRALLVETDRAGVGCAPACGPTTGASIRVLAKCGFTELRGADEEGQLVMARPLPVTGAGG